MAASVGSELIAAIVGYQLSILQQTTSNNLPQRIAVLCEANTANQGTLDISEWQATSLKAVGTRYGFGSPAYHIARIMLPVIGGIPLVFYPQAAAVGATAKIYEITPVGTATANATHTIVIGGRNGIDAQFYNITIVAGDTSDEITAKISNAINNVLGAPVIASDTDYVSTLTSKWEGETANGITVSVDTKENDAGITYTVNSTSDGAGIPSISAALTLMEPSWNTIGVNSYGTNTTICDALEQWTGIPDPETPTGRYVGTIMKPIIWLTGSVAEDPSSFTDSRSAEVAISISPAPLSLGLPMEAAANDAAVWALIAQNKPEIDVLDKFYIDMPTPTTIGVMANYSERDRIVKKGCSTVDQVSGKYQLKDPVTTFHPDGDLRPAFRYRRDLMIDFIIRYRYRILENLYVIGKAISDDNATVAGDKEVIRPKDWKAILISSLFAGLENDALIADKAYSASSLIVGIDENNPNRFNTSFGYLKTGIARISATDAQSGVNLGTFNA
jgi:phage tail sheath gpL-like